MADRHSTRGVGDVATRSSRVVERLDRGVAGLLRVQPQRLILPEAVATTGSEAFETPRLFSALRCIARYIVLPFVLPLAGVATSATFGIVTGTALGVLLILDAIAVIAIVATLRRLWRFQHPRRCHYLPVALALAALVGLFFIHDAGMLLPNQRL